MVRNELLCLYDIYTDLFLWVLVRRNTLSLSGISLFSVYAGVTQAET